MNYSDGSGGSGSGDWDDNPPPTTSTTKPTTISKPLPKMRKQLGQTCVTTCMEFINKFFGGDKKVGDFNRAYNKKYSTDIYRQAMQGAHTESFVNEYFTTTGFISYENAVANDQMVMVSILDKQTVTVDNDSKIAYVNNLYHVMVVVGCNTNETLTVMDPGTGEERVINKSDVVSGKTIVITGNK